LTDLAAALPDQVSGFVAEGAVQRFDTESIFGYIDGHAEVFLAYGMKACISRRYEGPSATMILDLFRMASAEDAYGVFTHDLDGTEVGIGQGSRYRYGWLSFWQGSTFVSLTVDDESDSAVAAVHELGRFVAGLISDRGELPEIVASLPAAGLDGGTVRFFHNPQILNSHRFVGSENPLRLGTDTPAALGSYRRGDREARLLVVNYPDEARAEEARASIVSSLELDPQGAPVEVERGWQSAEVAGRCLALVLDASDSETAAEILEETCRSAIGGTQ